MLPSLIFIMKCIYGRLSCLMSFRASRAYEFLCRFIFLHTHKIYKVCYVMSPFHFYFPYSCNFSLVRFSGCRVARRCTIQNTPPHILSYFMIWTIHDRIFTILILYYLNRGNAKKKGDWKKITRRKTFTKGRLHYNFIKSKFFVTYNDKVKLQRNGTEMYTYSTIFTYSNILLFFSCCSNQVKQKNRMEQQKYVLFLV